MIFPVGKGYYTRSNASDSRFDFVIINAWRSDAAALVANARAHGIEPWLYGGPSRFEPGAWRAGIAHIAAIQRSTGAAGVIIDAEGGWPQLTSAARRAELRALGTAIAALTCPRGFTAYPSFPDLTTLVEYAGPDTFYQIQIYGRTAQAETTFDAWFARWRAICGPRVIIVAAAWPSSPLLSTLEGYRTYLSRLPAAASVAYWTTQGDGPPPGFYSAPALAHEPGGDALTTAFLAAQISSMGLRSLALIALAFFAGGMLAWQGI